MKVNFCVHFLIIFTFLGSLSAKALLLGDRIVDVDGLPVTDKNVARDLLLRGLQVDWDFFLNILAFQKNQTVSLVIERAETNEAKEIVKKALATSELEPPSVVLNSDVQDIIRRQKEKMKAQGGDKPKTVSSFRKEYLNAFFSGWNHSQISIWRRRTPCFYHY